jgi:hypothetical protein
MWGVADPGRAGYRELRKRGVSVREAWVAGKSEHRPLGGLEDSGARTGSAGAVLGRNEVTCWCGTVGIIFIEPPCACPVRTMAWKERGREALPNP